MTRYPLLFGRRELVEGDGFVARVTVSGRALLTDEDGEFWVEGVNPGGFAARGESPSEALAALGSTFRTILFDIASNARSFESFREEAQRFFEETSAPALQDWEEAVRQVRAGRIDANWLVKRPAETKLGIEVVEVSRPAASASEPGDRGRACQENGPVL